MNPLSYDALLVGQHVRMYWKEKDGRPGWIEGLVTEAGPRFKRIKVEVEALPYRTDKSMIGAAIPLYANDILLLLDETKTEKRDRETLAYIKSRLGGVDYEDIRKEFDKLIDEDAWSDIRLDGR